MAKCSARKKDGAPCTLDATHPDGMCWAHSTYTEENRRRGKVKGGKAKPGLARLAEIDKALTELASGVMDGTMDRARAAIAIQALNARIRLASVEVAVKSQTVVTDTFAELEARLQERRDSFGSGDENTYR
jgi:hypothetical protein